MTSDTADERRERAMSGTEAQLRACLIDGLNGDSIRYRRFLDGLSGHLRAYLRRRLPRGQDDVEDILQETLLAVHNARHTYRPEQPLTAWVHAIARYKLVDHLRRTGRHAGNRPLDDEAFQFADRPAIPAAEARLDLDRAMASLPERTRLLIDRVRLQGTSVAEAASAAGMTESAAKVAIHRGLQAMAKFLSRSGARST